MKCIQEIIDNYNKYPKLGLPIPYDISFKQWYFFILYDFNDIHNPFPFAEFTFSKPK